MSKFFNNKKVMIAIVAAIIAIMVGLIIGSNIVNTMKAKEKAAEKAKIEKTIDEKKEIEKKIEKAQADEPSEEDNYTEEYKEYLELSDEEKAKSDVVPRKEQVDFDEIKKIEEDQKEDLGVEYVLEEDKQEDDDKEVLPQKFDLRDKINIVVGNQGYFGLCWDYSYLTSVQTNLSLRQGKDYNFSEGHVDYMTSNLMCVQGRDVNCGGNYEEGKKYNDIYGGFVLEKNVPQNVYEEYEYNTFYNMPKEEYFVTKYVDFPRMAKDEEMTQEELKKYEEDFKEFQTAVKTHIMNYGSVSASIYSPWGNTLYTSSNDDVRPDHMISIVGWDDTYSRDNFTSFAGEKPEHDGAYIVLNSWGEDWGNNGYFYISYEDNWVNREMSAVVSVNDKSDLINVSSLGKNVRKYIEDNYSKQIFTIDGEEYIRDESLSSYVDLSNRNISDVSEFELVLSKAKWIDLSDNDLDSIDGLEKYIHEDDVYIVLRNNNIKDVSCLKDLKLSSLILDSNYGVTGYENLNISYRLSLKDCGITSFEVTDSLKDMESLSLSGNNIEDFSSIAKLEKLFNLDIDNCNISSIEEIKDIFKIDSLNYLDLSNNNLKDITGIEEASIYEIDLSNNTEIEDFEPLRKIKKVSSIVLKNCNIKDAKDVVVEFVTEEDIERMLELLENSEYMEDVEYVGISYVLSDNKGISNLKALKNATFIDVTDCDLGDISELKELKGLNGVELSHNHNLSGDLSGMTIGYMTLNDCGLDNSFNLFNIDSVINVYLLNNEITNVDNFESKVRWDIYLSSYEGEYTTKSGACIVVEDEDKEKKERIIEIEIPDEDDLKMNLAKYVINSEERMMNVKVNGKVYDSFGLVPIDENTRISYFNYADGTTIIEFKINKNMNSTGLEVIYDPYLSELKDDNTINKDNIRVANRYGNEIFSETHNFELESDIYKTPYTYVERGSGDNKRYIPVPEKYYMLVSQGNYTAKYAVGRMSGYNIIDVGLCEDLTPPDDFEEEFPTLRFNSEELYNIAKDYWEGLYVRADDDLLTIELKEYRERNDSGLPMYIPRDLLNDVKGLEPMIITDIYILMDMDNGMDRIEEEDLKVLESFPDLKYIYIITPPEEYNELDLIIPQDKYVVTIENDVG